MAIDLTQTVRLSRPRWQQEVPCRGRMLSRHPAVLHFWEALSEVTEGLLSSFDALSLTSRSQPPSFCAQVRKGHLWMPKSEASRCSFPKNPRLRALVLLSHHFHWFCAALVEFPGIPGPLLSQSRLTAIEIESKAADATRVGRQLSGDHCLRLAALLRGTSLSFWRPQKSVRNWSFLSHRLC